MPELVYNVKFQIDDGGLGRGSAGVSSYKEKVKELKEEIDRLKASQDNFNESAENLDGTIGKTNKQVALGNQLFFSLSDGIQDSTQFAYGFGTGMRAVGNNIGFTTELAGAFIQRTREMNNGVLSLSGVMQGLRSSIMGVGGVVFAINTLVTLYTAFALRQEKAQRSTAKMNDEVRSLSQSLFSGLNFQALETSREIEILSSILDNSTKSVEDLSDAVIDQTQFQLSLTPAVADATHVFSQYTQSAQDAQNEVTALKIAEEQAAKARKDAVLEVVRQRLAELEATQLIRDTMRELGVVGIAAPFEGDMIGDVLPQIEEFNNEMTLRQEKTTNVLNSFKEIEGQLYREVERDKLDAYKQRTEAEVALEQRAILAKADAYSQLASGIFAIGSSLFEQNKALATAEAIISTYFSAQKAYESTIAIPGVGPFAAQAAAAAAVAQGIARVIAIQRTQIGNSAVAGSASGGRFGFQMSNIEGAQTFRTPSFSPSSGNGMMQPKVDVRIMADRKQLYAIVKQGEEEYRQIKV